MGLLGCEWWGQCVVVVVHCLRGRGRKEEVVGHFGGGHFGGS